MNMDVFNAFVALAHLPDPKPKRFLMLGALLTHLNPPEKIVSLALPFPWLSAIGGCPVPIIKAPLCLHGLQR